MKGPFLRKIEINNYIVNNDMMKKKYDSLEELCKKKMGDFHDPLLTQTLTSALSYIERKSRNDDDFLGCID